MDDKNMIEQTECNYNNQGDFKTKISIIVPIYNTEKYLEKCLNSLTNQTLKDIEIICVDDGSTDNSLQIVQKLAQNDSRIKILTQENKKQGAARNYGLTVATGEYIGYIDSDDWVDLDYFEKLYNAAKKYNSDVALATNIRVKNGKTKKRLNITEEKFYTSNEDKIVVCDQYRNSSPCNKIYRQSILKEHNISFPEGIYCEDKMFTLEAIYYANGVVSVPDVYYYYYRNPSSTVKSKENKKQLEIDKENTRRQMLDFLREKKINVPDKMFWATKKEYKFLGIPVYTIKESLKTEKHFLFGCIQYLTKQHNEVL